MSPSGAPRPSGRCPVATRAGGDGRPMPMSMPVAVTLRTPHAIPAGVRVGRTRREGMARRREHRR